MNTFVAISFVAVLLQLGAAEEERQFVFKEETFTAEEEQCVKDLHINKAELVAVIKQITRYLPEDNVDFTNFLSCFWKKVKFQEENGVIIYDNILQIVQGFPRFKFGSDSADPVGLEIAKQSVESCKNIPQGNSHGQTAAKSQNCITNYIVKAIK